MAAGEKGEVRRGLSAKGGVLISEAAQLRQTSAKQLCWHATLRGPGSGARFATRMAGVREEGDDCCELNNMS
jgi:hypothetical protein